MSKSRDFLLIALAIIISPLSEHLRNIIAALRLGDWGLAMSGIEGSLVGTGITLALVGIIVWLLHRGDERRERENNRVILERNIELANSLQKAVTESMQEVTKQLQDSIQPLIQEIRQNRNERKNKPE